MKRNHLFAGALACLWLSASLASAQTYGLNTGDSKVADLQNQIAQLDAVIRQKQTAMSDCAKARIVQMDMATSTLSLNQKRLDDAKAEQQRLNQELREAVHSKEYKALIQQPAERARWINGIKTRLASCPGKIAKYQSDVEVAQAKRNSIGNDLSCERQLQAQIFQAHSQKTRLQGQLSSARIDRAANAGRAAIQREPAISSNPADPKLDAGQRLARP